MFCPCVPFAWFGSIIGSYLGVKPPKHQVGKNLSYVITPSLVSITVIALDVLFNVSLCVKEASLLRNGSQLLIKGAVLGFVYSIGVNYLLKRYVFPEELEKGQDSTLEECLTEDEESLSCCCKKASKNP